MRERILDCAIRIFAVRGFDATSMREISDDLGVSVAALYHHFPGKSEILEAIVERGYGEIHDALAKVPTGGDAVDEVRAVVRQIILTMHDGFGFATAARFDRPAIVATMGDRYRELRLVAIDRLEDAIRRGQSEGTIRSDLDPRVAVRVLSGMWNWMPDWYVPGSSSRAVDVADLFATIAVDGVQRVGS
jgi:AcrR family transcriptional regulator